MLQQNMYTPSDICTTYHVPGSRPYAGWLGAEIGKQLFADADSPWSHYAAVNFGMVGPSSQAGNTQIKIHEWLDCRKPMGWDTQLSDEFCVNAQWWTKYNWYICDYVALIPRGGVLAGTLQDAAEIGADLKVGWNIRKHKDRGGANQMFSAVMPGQSNTTFWDKLVVYAFFGGDCRYYLYNHFLEGSLFNSKDKDVTVDIEPFVGEMCFGAYLEVYGVFVRYYATIRTHEYKTQTEAPDFGGLHFGYRWNF
jgi:lipid A 3-O-deacylase